VGALGTQGLKRRYEQPINGRVVVLYHSETLRANSTTDFWNICYVIKELDLQAIFIESNADNGALAINRAIDTVNYESSPNGCWQLFSSKFRDDFLSLLSGCDAIIGNSSSGILEAPALGIPTINIGRRQEGRLKASSIINVPEPTMGNIEKAFDTLYSKEFQAGLSNIYAPYGKGENVAGKILDIIKEQAGNIDMMKGFYDVPFTT